MATLISAVTTDHGRMTTVTLTTTGSTTYLYSDVFNQTDYKYTWNIGDVVTVTANCVPDAWDLNDITTAAIATFIQRDAVS